MSNIEWTDKSWNPVVGCTKLSEGCRNCYAFNLHNSRHKAYQEGKLQHIPQYSKPFDDVQLLPERLISPLRWKKPQKVFVNSMSDLFHEDVPFEFIGKVFAVMALAQQHNFQILTKRPERMIEFMERTEWRESMGLAEWPLSNVWLGVSVENQQAADERIPLLLETPAAVRFLSCEPLLGPVKILGELMQGKDPGKCGNCGGGHGFTRCSNYGGVSKSSERYECHDFKRVDFAIDWVIVGGESGHKARPMHPEWARSLRDQCQAAGVPFFFKQWGEWVPSDQYPSELNGVRLSRYKQYTFEDVHKHMFRVGKKRAGRLLDGEIYDAYPIDRKETYK